MPITINGSGTITGASTLATTVASPTLTTPNINSASVPTVSGTAPLYMARAWVNFDGTGTVAIRASGNVSSITDHTTGSYTVNYTTALSASPAPVITVTDDSTSNRGANVQNTNDTYNLTTSCRISCFTTNTGVAADSTGVYFAILR